MGGGLRGEFTKQALFLHEEHQVATTEQEAVWDPGLDTTLKSLVPARNRTTVPLSYNP